jgi:hypothetical protein
MPGPKPRKKPKVNLTPEKVAAYESMKPGCGKSGANPYPKKNKKTLKHNITKKTQANSEHEIDRQEGTWREWPVTDRWINQLATQLVEWVEEKNHLKFNEFLRERKINPDSFKRWENRIPNLKSAHTYAIRALGDIREIGAIRKEFDKGMILPVMHRYDPEWKKSEEWHASLTQKDSDKPTQTLVVIDKAVETTIVPPLKKDKDE